MKEIEIKLIFKNKDKIIKILKPDIRFIEKIKLHDSYYGLKNDMSNKNVLFRIRRKGNNHNELTYKGRALDKKNIWHRIELTTHIESPIVIEKILEQINFKKISEYKSEKEVYGCNGLEICFTKFTLPAKLEFMEIEGKSEKKIRNLVNKIGTNAQEVGEEIFKTFDRVRNK